MPIYEYLCGSCGHVLDALQKVSDDPLTYCPECGKPELKRQLSAPAFRLKGGGWYETDFKDKNRKNVVRADGDSKPASDAKPSPAKAEKKPAAKGSPD
jgi:putative FmdB family regulatory protein